MNPREAPICLNIYSVPRATPHEKASRKKHGSSNGQHYNTATREHYHCFNGQRRSEKAPKDLTDSQLHELLQDCARMATIDLSEGFTIDEYSGRPAPLIRVTSFGSTELTSLKLCNCVNLTDAGLAHLVRLTQLTALDLSGCSKITDAGLSHLKGMTQLTSLKLCNCVNLTDAGLAHLVPLTQLTALDLSGCSKITDVGLVHLKGMTRLTSVTFPTCEGITEQGKLLVHLFLRATDVRTPTQADAKWQLPNGTTLLHVAVRNGNAKICAELLENGAEVNVVDGGGQTPLHVGAQENSVDCVKLLLKKDPDVGIKDANGRTAVELALSRGSNKTAILLVNIVNANGDAPLHVGVTAGDTTLVENLIATGGKVNARNKDGQTPLHLAVTAGNKSLISKLVTFNASRHIVDHSNRSPASIARDGSHNYFDVVPDQSAADTVANHLMAAERIRSLIKSVGSDAGAWAFLHQQILALGDACRVPGAVLFAAELSTSSSEFVKIAKSASDHTARIRGSNPSPRDSHREELMAMSDEMRRATAGLHDIAARLKKEDGTYAPELPPFLVEWEKGAKAQLADWKNDAESAIKAWGAVMCAEGCGEHRSPEERVAAIAGVCCAQLFFDAALRDIRERFPYEEVVAAKEKHREELQRIGSCIQEALQQLTSASTAAEELGVLSCGPKTEMCSESLQKVEELINDVSVLRHDRRILIQQRTMSPKRRKKAPQDLEQEIQELDIELKTKKSEIALLYKALEVAVPRWFPEHTSELTRAVGGFALPKFDPSISKDDCDAIQKTHAPAISKCTMGEKQLVLKSFDNLEKAQRECEGLHRIESSFVVPLVKTFADIDGTFVAVMPYYSGNQIDVWLRPRLLVADGSGAEALLRVMAEVAEGVAAIHKADVVHCDLKWENIVMTSEGDSATPKVIDLDVCVGLEQRTTKLFTATMRAPSLGGSKGWLAPEIEAAGSAVALQGAIAPAVDIFALGLLLARLISGDFQTDFASPWTLPAHNAVPENLSPSTLKRLAEVKAPLEALARAMLSRDPKCRPEAKQVAATLKKMLATLTKDAVQQQVARLAITSCCACLGDITEGDSVACKAGHAFCQECLTVACGSWAEEPLARHCEKGKELFCMHGDCGAALPKGKVVRLCPAIDPLLTRVAEQVAVYKAIEEHKQCLASETLLQRAIRRVDEEILALRCPRCRTSAVVDFQQCLAVTCPACKSMFCGYCGEDTKGDAHAHVGNAHRDRVLFHGPLFTTEAQWRKLWHARHRQRLDEYLRTLPDDVAADVKAHLGL